MKETYYRDSHYYAFDYDEGGVRDAIGTLMDSTDEYIEEMNMLVDDLRKMKIALHEAIKRPMGVVPHVAEEFYDQNYYDTLS
jgi:hypothetical protein